MSSGWDDVQVGRGIAPSGLGRGRGTRAVTAASSSNVGSLADKTASISLNQNNNDDWGSGWGSQNGTSSYPRDEPRGGGSRPMKCFKCQQEGHMSRECPNQGDGGGGGGGSRSRACFKCNEEGHMSRECPNQGDGGGGGGGSRSRACFKCNEEGHMSRECPNQGDGGGGGGSRSRACFKCNEEGHMSRDCPNQGDGNRSRGCHKCGQDGHFARECPNQESGGGARSSGCRKCGEDGHFARECPNAEASGGNSGACFRCGGEGHMSRDCTEPAKTADGKPRETNYIPPDIEDDENAIFNLGVSTGINFERYDSIPMKVTGEDATMSISSFEEANLRPIVMENIRRSNYLKPTPVQKCCIPAILARRDLMACAQTGSGKTAAFLIPIVNVLLSSNCAAKSFEEVQYPEVIVVGPTRELAVQIYNESKKFSHGSVIKSQVCYGGTSVGHQLNKLRTGTNILIATPGRLLDFIEKGVVNLSKLMFLVLDEADRMLDMGFKPDIDKIFMNPYFPPKEQRSIVMFSATFPDTVQHMASEYLNNYLYAVVGVVGGTNPDVSLEFHQVRQADKREKLVEILQEFSNEKVIIFVSSKKLVDYLAAHLCNAGFQATCMHGDRFQSQREEALNTFRRGKHNILVATSVAARGLDVKDVAAVINYDLPNDPEEYVHKIGRTGRVGNTGRAISFFDPDRDVAVAGALVAKLVESEQEVPDFLQAVVGGASGGYGFRAGGDRRFANSDIRRQGGFQPTASRSAAPQVAESVDSWD